MKASPANLPKGQRPLYDLGFISKKPNGFGQMIPAYWNPLRAPREPGQWDSDRNLGAAYAKDLRTIRTSSELDVFNAIVGALNDRAWKTGGSGVEYGFTCELASLVIAGIRAIDAGAAPFDPELAATAEGF